MRRLLMPASLLLIISSGCVLASIATGVNWRAMGPGGLRDDMLDHHGQWVLANWLFAAGALVAIPGLVLRHVSRMNVSVLAKSLSAAAHTVFITGCLLGLTLAALRLGYGATEPTTVDRGLLWMVWGTNNTLLLGLVLVFGFGFLLDAGFCWSGLETLGQAAALLSTAVGLLLIGSGVADVAAISPMTPFLTMAVLGFVLLIRAIDNAPATPTLQSAGRAKSPG